jgi:single-stranded DNA-binding protein
MNGTSYIGGIVKILETPKQKNLTNNILVTKFRVQLPQRRNTRIITLSCWGNLAHDVATYYQTNDYLLIEGYLSFRNQTTLNVSPSKSKKIEITVLKLYPVQPFGLISENSMTKT